jgi:hypothetical protein
MMWGVVRISYRDIKAVLSPVGEMVRSTVLQTLNGMLDAKALWGMRASRGATRDLDRKLYERIEAWRHRKIEKAYQTSRALYVICRRNRGLRL